MTANDVRKALRKRYGDTRRYAIAEEVSSSTGYAKRRLDMMVLDCYYSNGFRIDGFEIKVSTSDLRRELECPDKHIAFFDVIDYYTLAVPSGVVEPVLDSIPQKWGIMIINEDGNTRYKRKPLALEDKTAQTPVPRGFLASVVRNIQEHEPSKQELAEAYDRGKTETEERIKRYHDYMQERVQKESDKLEAYDKLCARFNIWKTENIDDILSEFETFRQFDMKWLQSDLMQTSKRLNELVKMIDHLKDGGGGGNEI